uniref:Uncharacterized protein n=1 Tax=Anguilla anguilla TaxID=7936 RepID=A0A0E9V080_ANGAN
MRRRCAEADTVLAGICAGWSDYQSEYQQLIC